MTSLEYKEQNRKGFEGDDILRDFVKQVIEENKIERVLEGGTYIGSTTKLLSEWCFVDTIEINIKFYEEAKRYLKSLRNIRMHFGSTVDLMPNIISEYVDDNYLFFCDSHWGQFNPLLKELEIIADARHKPFIIIHDFKVPNRPELEYDTYNGQDYEWEWINGSIDNIYGKEGYNIEYNSKANGAKRGIIFISKK